MVKVVDEESENGKKQGVQELDQHKPSELAEASFCCAFPKACLAQTKQRVQNHYLTVIHQEQTGNQQFGGGCLMNWKSEIWRVESAARLVKHVMPEKTVRPLNSRKVGMYLESEYNLDN